MDAKKIGLLVFLVAVIVAAVYFSAKRSGVVGGEPAGKGSLDAGQPLELIDKNTLEVMTKPMSEWKTLGAERTGYKNPKTGTYTMVDTMICAACGATIPRKARWAHGNYEPSMAKCPKCGKNPFGMPPEAATEAP